MSNLDSFPADFLNYWQLNDYFCLDSGDRKEILDARTFFETTTRIQKSQM
jgi:hypothetical protein